MLDRKVILGFVLGCLSALSAVGIGFWFTQSPKGFDFSDSYSVPGDCCGYGYTGGDFSSKGGFGDAGRIIRRAPEETRKILADILRKLSAQPNEQLYILRNEDDPCSATEIVDCRDVPSKLVKQIIDAALDDRKFAKSLEAAYWNTRVALVSCFISILALGISFIKFWRSKPV